MEDQRAPATTDIEQVLAGMQLEFPADQLKLGPLSLFEAIVDLLEVAAGVDHRRIQPESVERIGQVVAEGGGVGFFCVRVHPRRNLLAQEPFLSVGFRSDRARQHDGAEQQACASVPDLALGLHVLPERQGSEEVALDVEVVAEIGFGQALWVAIA
nr:hypothetical protein [Pseudomonas aeruginosa]